MPKLFRVLTGSVIFAFLALATIPAGAVMLDTTASLSVQIATLEPPTMTGSGSASSMGGPGSAHTIPAGFLSLATAVVVPIAPKFVGLGAVSLPVGVTAPGGTFAPGGAMPVNGSALFFTGTQTGAGTAGEVPLQPLGGGGTNGFMVGPLSGTLFGATWQGAGTAGPQVFVGTSNPLAIPITVTATAYDNRMPDGRGVVQLVAPATGGLGTLGELPVFGVLRIAYDAPEPGMIGLALVGGTILVAAGRRKLRKS